jgi:hypothetical protein
MVGSSDELDSERVSVYCRVSETLSEIFRCPLNLTLFEVPSWKGKVRGLTVEGRLGMSRKRVAENRAERGEKTDAVANV